MNFKKALRGRIGTQALRVEMLGVCNEGVCDCVRRSVSGGLIDAAVNTAPTLGDLKTLSWILHWLKCTHHSDTVW